MSTDAQTRYHFVNFHLCRRQPTISALRTEAFAGMSAPLRSGCTSQHDADEKIKVIGEIPHIFACATNVVVVQDGDGLPRCCSESFGNLANGCQTTFAHIRSHHSAGGDCFPESYLQRPWTLQELAVCRTIDFTSCAELHGAKYR